MAIISVRKSFAPVRQKLGTWQPLDVVVLAAALIAIILLTRPIPYELTEYATWDLWSYRDIALAAPGLADAAEAPFAYRFPGPWLVGITPLPIDTSFFLWTMLFQVIAMVLMYAFLKSYIRNRNAVLFATVGFVLTKFLFIFTLFDYFQVKDMIGFSALLGVLLLTRRGSPVLAGLLIAITIPFSESILVAVPVLFVHTTLRMRSYSALVPILLTTLAALAIFIAIRVLIEAPGPTLVDQFRDSWDKILSPYIVLKALINPFLPLVLIPILYFRSTLSLLAKEIHLVVLVLAVLGASLWGTNLERLMLMAAPVYFLVIAHATQENLIQRKGTLLVLLGAAVVASQHHRSTALPFPTENSETVALTLVASAIAATALAYAWLSARRTTPADEPLTQPAAQRSERVKGTWERPTITVIGAHRLVELQAFAAMQKAPVAQQSEQRS